MASAFQDHARLELLARTAVGVGELSMLDDEAAPLAALERAGTADLMRAFATRYGYPTRPGLA